MAVEAGVKNQLFKEVLAATLAEVNDTEVFRELKKEKDDGHIELETYYRILKELNASYLPLAFGFAADIAKEDPNKEEKSNLEKEILECEKEILCEQRPIKLNILKDDRTISGINAERVALEKNIIIEQRPVKLEALVCEKETLCLQKDILNDEKNVRKNILNADLAVKQQQYIVEVARGKLLAKQRIGFDDNITLERYKASAEVIGMIMSGGNEAPAELWTELNNAIGHLVAIDSHHEEG